MIDVLEAVYWDETQETQSPVVRRRWNPLRRKRLTRREREQSATKETLAEEEAASERVLLDLARRGGLLVGLRHRQVDFVAEQQERALAAQAQVARRETLAAERETLFRRVRQAATVVAGLEQQGAQPSAAAHSLGERQAGVGLAPWAQGLQPEMGDWGEAATLWPPPEPGLEELDRGFERDARRYDRRGF